ncbi:MAG: chorismate-binding protein, partial [Pyrinomonadaceae bacterium]
MIRAELKADDLSGKLLELASDTNVCILDSCGVGHLGSHLMVAGVEPVKIVELHGEPEDVLAKFETLVEGDNAVIFSISYDFGAKFQRLFLAEIPSSENNEPDIFAAVFDTLIVYDYTTGKINFIGNRDKSGKIRERISKTNSLKPRDGSSSLSSNFSRAEYLRKIEEIKEYIRVGDTYQTNLTQQFQASLSDDLTPEIVFAHVRRDHPAPFAAYLKRLDSTVVSASPERFFRIANGTISASPIKGTRPRGATKAEDDR